MGEMVLKLPDTGEDCLGRLIRRINEHIVRAVGPVSGSGETDLGDGKGRAYQGASFDHRERASAILDRYGNSILRMAYSYLHNMSDAEDILQDVLVQYIKTKPELDGEEHEKAWLLRVACNLSKNRIKYNKIRETDELMEELVAEEAEDLGFVWEAVKALPVKYSEVIHLFYEEGLSTSEIAGVLDRKESTVRSDLKRGREKLKEILKEAYDFE